jgi:hypothetical protein
MGILVNATKKVNVSAPWWTYYRKLDALFGKDPDIHTTFEEEKKIIVLRVENQDKAEALAELLPGSVQFGNVKVSIVVLTSNENTETRAELIKKALKGNPALSYDQAVEGVMTNPLHYFVMRNEVAQFWNDNLHDINGRESYLYEDLAREIIGEDDGVMFCTNTPDNPDHHERLEDDNH